MPSDNKRIASNTMYLYLRMIFSLVVKLYTSRVILEVLGVMDYGLWNLVAGLVSLFVFLNISMAGCTNRFISHELGKKDSRDIQSVFSSALTIHLLIALLVFVLSETAGLWLLENKLVIPEDRLQVCRVIFQLSLINLVFSIIQVPYNAMIMSHERMSVFARLDIMDVSLRLLIVLILPYLSIDKLLLLGSLTTVLCLLMFSIYRFYCITHFSGCRFILSRDWSMVRPMLVYSGWDLYGNASVVARTQGVSMLLNIFFTATMNAANGVAVSIQTAVMSFGRSVHSAFRPQIFKSYAAGNSSRTCLLIYKCASFTTALLLLMIVPLEIEIDYILHLWLGQPPLFAASFARMILLFYLVIGIADTIQMGIHAVGNIKCLSIVNGTIYLSVLPLSYCIFQLGGEPWSTYLLALILSVISFAFVSLHLHSLMPCFSASRILSIFWRVSMVGGFAYAVGKGVAMLMPSSFARLFVITAITTVIISFGSYMIVFDADDRHSILCLMRKKMIHK